jgi:hypothetical protein
MLRITPPGQPPAMGLADDKGRATVFFPYPEPPGLDTSPPGLGARALAEQRWDHIAVEASYSRLTIPESNGLPTVPGPDLADLLSQEPAILLDSDSPFTPLTEVTLEFGRELVVRSAAESQPISPPAGPAPLTGCRSSVLFIVPSTSP